MLAGQVARKLEAGDRLQASMLSEMDGLYVLDEDVQLAGLVERNLPKPRGRPAYLWPSELSNPAQAFYDRMGIDAPKDDVLKDRLAAGNVVGRMFAASVRKVEGMHGEESTLDGAYVDMEGIVGRIDNRYKDSIVEFKTTPYDIVSGEDLWNLAPQYIAQLLVYAAIWTKESREHLVVVMSMIDRKPGELRVFRVKIQDMRLLRRHVAALRDLLAECIEKETPETLGRCVYFDNHCQYQAAGACGCEEFSIKIRDWLGQGVTVDLDENLTDKLQAVWQDSREARPLHPIELQSPRQHYSLHVHGDDAFSFAPLNVRRAEAKDRLRRALMTSGLLAAGTDIASLERPAEPGPAIGYTWLKLPKTKGTGSTKQVAPALLREWDEGREPGGQDGKMIYGARQIAAVAAFHGLASGYILWDTPNLSAPVRATKVKVTKQGAARNVVVQDVHKIRKAVEAKDPSNLDLCPDFVRRDCPLANCPCR